MMKKIILTLFVVVFCPVLAFTQDDREAALSVVNQLFDGMKAKSAEQIKGVFAPDVHFLAIDKPRDGKGISKSRITTGEAFAKTISESKSEEYKEKMISPDVR